MSSVFGQEFSNANTIIQSLNVSDAWVKSLIRPVQSRNKVHLFSGFHQVWWQHCPQSILIKVQGSLTFLSGYERECHSFLLNIYNTKILSKSSAIFYVTPTAMCTLWSLLEFITLLSLTTGAILQITGKRASKKLLSGFEIRHERQLRVMTENIIIKE